MLKTSAFLNLPLFPHPHTGALFLMEARVKLMKSFDQTFSEKHGGV